MEAAKMQPARARSAVTGRYTNEASQTPDQVSLACIKEASLTKATDTPKKIRVRKKTLHAIGEAYLYSSPEKPPEEIAHRLKDKLGPQKALRFMKKQLTWRARRAVKGLGIKQKPTYERQGGMEGQKRGGW
eukprot:5985131-Prorocentrum_lima.AAC.1